MNARFAAVVLVLTAVILGGCSPGTERQALSSVEESLQNSPDLVVHVVVDGLLPETLYRYWDHLSDGGFKRFLNEGASFSNAHQLVAGTWTGQGHPTILTGTYPSTHGVLSDGWLDRETGEVREPFFDANYRVLGVETDRGYSPLDLDVSTLPDELRRSTNFRSKVVSVAANDKAAIPHGGRLGTAYWLQGAAPPFDLGTPHFVTSTYYMESYPDWWEAFHEGNPADAYFDTDWGLLLEEQAYALAAASPELPYFEKRDWLGWGTEIPLNLTGGLDEPGSDYYVALAWSPFAHDFTVDFAAAAVQGENLGRNEHGVPDFLSVGFPSYDFVKHVFGTEAVQTLDAFYRTDRALEQLLDFLDEWIGLDNTLVFLTADHGPGTDPDFATEVMRFEADRLDVHGMIDGLEDHLSATFGTEDGAYVQGHIVPFIYLDHDFIAREELSVSEVETESVAFLRDFPGVHTVYTRSRLAQGGGAEAQLEQKVLRSWNYARGGDLYIIQKPFWYYWDHPQMEALGAMHGSPWTYDTHIPVAFLGDRWIRGGEYNSEVSAVDIAPTLSHILRIAKPSASEGRILQEMLPDQ